MAASKTTETVIKVYCFFPLLDLLLKKYYSIFGNNFVFAQPIQNRNEELNKQTNKQNKNEELNEQTNKTKMKS